jgi:hypothetical protein
MAKKVNKHELKYSNVSDVPYTLTVVSSIGAYYTKAEAILHTWSVNNDIKVRKYVCSYKKSNKQILWQYYRTVNYPKRLHVGGPLDGQVLAHLNYGEEGYLPASLMIQAEKHVSATFPYRKIVYVYIGDLYELKEKYANSQK